MAAFRKPFKRSLAVSAAVLAVVLAAGISAGQSAGQSVGPVSDTTQPANDVPPQWRQVVSDVAMVLGGELPQGRQSALAQRVTQETLIHRFNHLDRDSAQQMCDQLAGLSIVCQRGYAGIPDSMASDIAAAVRDSALPAPLKKQLAPDDAALRRANATASAWLTQTLEPADGDLVGVIVFCPETSASQSADSSDSPTIQFVIFKGCQTARGIMLTRIVYGDPLKLDD
jgi:hypothetical protein